MGAKCGTYAGWNAHKRYGQPVCQPCRDAAAQYMKEYRWRTGFTKTRRVPITQRELDMLAAMRRREQADGQGPHG